MKKLAFTCFILLINCNTSKNLDFKKKFVQNNSELSELFDNNEIQLMKLSNYNLAISDEEGKIMFFDIRTLNKRIEGKSDSGQNINKRNLLKKRLRALRE